MAVQYLGFPGWTSRQLLSDADGEQGIQTALKRIIQQSGAVVKAVVILAGTIDLPESEPNDIVDALFNIHPVCHDEGVHYTVAVDIPPSAFQSTQDVMALRAGMVNDALSQYCSV